MGFSPYFLFQIIVFLSYVQQCLPNEVNRSEQHLNGSGGARPMIAKHGGRNRKAAHLYREANSHIDSVTSFCSKILKCQRSPHWQTVIDDVTEFARFFFLSNILKHLSISDINSQFSEWLPTLLQREAQAPLRWFGCFLQAIYASKKWNPIHSN